MVVIGVGGFAGWSLPQAQSQPLALGLVAQPSAQGAKSPLLARLIKDRIVNGWHAAKRMRYVELRQCGAQRGFRLPLRLSVDLGGGRSRCSTDRCEGCNRLGGEEVEDHRVAQVGLLDEQPMRGAGDNREFGVV